MSRHEVPGRVCRMRLSALPLSSSLWRGVCRERSIAGHSQGSYYNRRNMDEDLKRHMDVLAEAADRKIDRILEILSLLDQKVDRHQIESRNDFAETRSMI